MQNVQDQPQGGSCQIVLYLCILQRTCAQLFFLDGKQQVCYNSITVSASSRARVRPALPESVCPAVDSNLLFQIWSVSKWCCRRKGGRLPIAGGFSDKCFLEGFFTGSNPVQACRACIHLCSRVRLRRHLIIRHLRGAAVQPCRIPDTAVSNPLPAIIVRSLLDTAQGICRCLCCQDAEAPIPSRKGLHYIYTFFIKEDQL